MGWMFWIMLLGILFLLVAIINGFVAPLEVHFRAKLPPQDDSPKRADAPFVGLALSGGGARAAAFGAAGMQALHARGLLAPVTHVSSVSGGGFAASYLATHPVPEENADRYFSDMQAVMGHDFFRDTQLGQLRKPRSMFSPSRRLTSLKESLERPDFLQGATFAALPKGRTFFLNAASYDTGHRFVFSNGTLPPADAAGDYALPPDLRALSFSNGEGRRPTPGEFPLSLAVATSAAFPPYLGPMTIQVDDAAGKPQEFWHLGDGGVFENTGVETLREAAYARGPKTRATIYSFDAGKHLDGDLSKNTHDISIWSRDVTRLVDVLSQYATTQRLALAKALDGQCDADIEVISFNYMEVVALAKSDNPPDPRWLSWDSWEHVTAQDRLESKTPADHLAKIPTALKITPCNQELIAAAAAFLVERRFPK